MDFRARTDTGTDCTGYCVSESLCRCMAQQFYGAQLQLSALCWTMALSVVAQALVCSSRHWCNSFNLQTVEFLRSVSCNTLKI